MEQHFILAGHWLSSMQWSGTERRQGPSSGGQPPNFSPFLLAEAAGSQLPTTRRATKRRRLQALMFLPPALNEARAQGPLN